MGLATSLEAINNSKFVELALECSLDGLVKHSSYLPNPRLNRQKHASLELLIVECDVDDIDAISVV